MAIPNCIITQVQHEANVDYLRNKKMHHKRLQEEYPSYAVQKC